MSAREPTAPRESWTTRNARQLTRRPPCRWLIPIAPDPPPTNPTTNPCRVGSRSDRHTLWGDGSTSALVQCFFLPTGPPGLRGQPGDVARMMEGVNLAGVPGMESGSPASCPAPAGVPDRFNVPGLSGSWLPVLWPGDRAAGLIPGHGAG